ncbi:hypothetical protein AGR1B_pTi0219 [Agrobacterium fabacearum S56]|uniref:Transposase n=1 Tax=Agrobacterium deltaense Zutra 3/1 TaxID=1183427 RepID=A0A1S7S5Q7_9HYPH|nr:hypothetical protein [Agrobacterium deltaense]ARU12384.1 hypothetical protein AgrTiEU6_161 [Agrobacterium tumefaciens]KJX85236.1 hypothetical protein SY94_6090 [Agrobacterium tumefaciens]CUX06629.1 hypothetical protein AGR1B_pTi0219 [Agrobacterium fabacearum S56]CUX62884.1 hypothetical protein AGR7C_pTi0050 [Agrobacterium deltaense Zutra 3/1]
MTGKGGLVALAGIRPQTRSDRSEGSGADGEHPSRRGHLLARSAGSRVGVFRALTLPQARAIIKEVATMTATWRDTAKAIGARSAKINRMASAFILKRALAL